MRLPLAVGIAALVPLFVLMLGFLFRTSRQKLVCFIGSLGLFWNGLIAMVMSRRIYLDPEHPSGIFRQDSTIDRAVSSFIQSDAMLAGYVLIHVLLLLFLVWQIRRMGLGFEIKVP